MFGAFFYTMKKRSILVIGLCTFFLLPYLSVAQTDSLRITLNIVVGSDSAYSGATLVFTDGTGKNQRYSASVVNGGGQMMVPKQKRCTEAVLQLQSKNESRDLIMVRPLSLWIDSVDINVAGLAEELEFASVSGGRENERYSELRASTADINRKMKDLYLPLMRKEVQANSSESEDIFNEIGVLSQKEADLQKVFIRDNPSLYVSMMLLYRMKNRYTSDDYGRAFNNLSTDFKDTKIAAEMQEMIQNEVVTSAGMPAITFERTTLKEESFKLDDLKGQVVLIDFWGSWCAPCKVSMPHLKHLYDKYKSSGFEIVGVAQEHGKTLEASKASWNKAVIELGLDWINVLNNEGKEAFDIVKAYRVRGFPTKILLDREGNVILRVTASATDDVDRALEHIYGF